MEVEKNMPGHRKEILQPRLGYLSSGYYIDMKLLCSYNGAKNTSAVAQSQSQPSMHESRDDISDRALSKPEGRMVYVFVGGWRAGLGLHRLDKEMALFKNQQLSTTHLWLYVQPEQAKSSHVRILKARERVPC